ncbi:MAG: hypothetical protein ACK5JM_10115 [Rhodoblastus sp.]
MTAFKTLSTGLAVAALGLGLSASTPAAADPGAVIAGVIGGVAVGAIIAGAANAANHNRYGGAYGGSYGYYQADSSYGHAPAYGYRQAYQPGYDYAPRCRVVQRPVYDGWGQLAGYRQSRRCR